MPLLMANLGEEYTIKDSRVAISKELASKIMI